MLETFFIPALTYALAWFLFSVLVQRRSVQTGLTGALYFVGWYAFVWIIFDLLCRFNVFCFGRFSEAK